MTTVQEITNIHKLIIFCFSVDDADNNLQSTLKAGAKLKAQATGCVQTVFDLANVLGKLFDLDNVLD